MHKECKSGGKRYLHFAIQSNKIMLELNLEVSKEIEGKKCCFHFE